MIHCRLTFWCEGTLGGTHDVRLRSLIKFFQRYYTSSRKNLFPLRYLGDHTVRTLMIHDMHFVVSNTVNINNAQDGLPLPLQIVVSSPIGMWMDMHMFISCGQ